MSSPPRLDFPSSDFGDVQMEDNTQEEQSVPEAPAPMPLFLNSPAETPSRPRRAGAPENTPTHGIMARRALGFSTPRMQKTPLFAGTRLCSFMDSVSLKRAVLSG